MELPGTTSRHRKSLTSDRFLGLLHQSRPESNGVELEEDDILWSGEDYSESHRISESAPVSDSPNNRRSRKPFCLENVGILAALSDENVTPGFPVLCRKKELRCSFSGSSSSSSLTIPRTSQPSFSGDSSSFPGNFQHQSAPVSVPVMLKISAIKRSNLTIFYDDGGEMDDEMLPPHEIVARGSARSPMTTFSVLTLFMEKICYNSPLPSVAAVMKMETVPSLEQQQQAGFYQEAASSGSRHGSGSIGPFFAVISVITVLAALACLMGRLFVGRQAGLDSKYDCVGWMERRCRPCIVGDLECGGKVVEEGAKDKIPESDTKPPESDLKLPENEPPPPPPPS